MSTVAFFHAHPDDEAIFTGGSIALLHAAGHRVVVVIATGGEAGAGAACSSLGELRAAETAAACAHLGVDRVEFLGYRDSGITVPGDALPGDAFALADVDTAGARLATLLREESATTLVFYDEGGIYGHADHLAVHRVGRRAAELADVATVYEATVDREYLHFVETHLVSLAALAMHEAVPTGVPTVVVSTTVDATSVAHLKRRAMAAHASQIPAHSTVMQFDDATFAAVYGYEWYVRSGPPGPLDDLAM